MKNMKNTGDRLIGSKLSVYGSNVIFELDYIKRNLKETKDMLINSEETIKNETHGKLINKFTTLELRKNHAKLSFFDYKDEVNKLLKGDLDNEKNKLLTEYKNYVKNARNTIYSDKAIHCDYIFATNDENTIENRIK